MQAAFDPYYRWLGIPPEEQPPNHYRLLGLQLFEADADVIETAADRQMLHVQTFKTGQHSSLSQKLLNEITAARLCLLSPEKKAQYDAQLRAALPASRRKTPMAAPDDWAGTTPVVPVAAETATQQAQGVGSVALPAIQTGPSDALHVYQARQQQSLATRGAIVGGAICLLAILAGVGWWMWSSAPRKPELAQVADCTIDEGQVLNLTLAAAGDPPEHPWVYQLQPGAPLGVELDRQTGRLTWAPGEFHGPGVHSIRVRAAVANDPSLFDELEFKVTVSETHQPPVLEPVTWPPLVNGELNVQLQGRDLDVPAGRLTYQASLEPPPENSPELDAATGRFRWRPGSSDFGKQYQVRLRVSKHSAPQLASEQVVTLVLPSERVSKSGAPQVASEQGKTPVPPSEREMWEKGLADLQIEVRRRSWGVNPDTGNTILIYLLNQQTVYVVELASPEQDEQSMAKAHQLLRNQIQMSKDNEWAVYRHQRRLIGVMRGDASLEAALTQLAGEPLAVISPQAPPMPQTMPAPASPTTPAEPKLTYERLAALLKPSPKQRTAVPEEEAVNKTLETLKEIFSAQYKQRKPQDQLKLADDLYAESQKPNSEPVARYVMLQESARLAVEAKDASRAWKALDRLIEEFDVDGLKLKLDALKKAGTRSSAVAAHRQTAQQYRELAEQAVREGRCDEAVPLMQSAVTAASRARDRELLDDYKERQQHVRAMADLAEKASSALETWKDNPDDAQANLHLGSYLCFWRDEWGAGLPLLAKSADTALAKAGSLDTAKPTKAEDQVAVGDAWREIGEQTRTPEKTPQLLRARYWYELARGQLSNLDQIALDKKLANLPSRPAPPPTVTTPATPTVVAGPASPTATANLPPLLPAGDPNLDRQAATIVIQLQGSVTIVAPNGAKLQVGPNGQLPSTPFVVKEIRFSNRLDDATLAHLQHLKYLEVLYCGLNTEMTDAGVAHLQNVHTLKSFTNSSARGSNLTDATLNVLAKLPNLETIHIPLGRFTDRGIAQLGQLKRLTSLDCEKAECSDATLQQLAKCTSLTYLALAGGQVTDEGIKPLTSLSGLTTLMIKSAHVSDAGAMAVARLSRLQRLTLEGDFSDQALEGLSHLSSLNQLVLGSPRITAAGLSRLSVLPRLQSLQLTAKAPPLTDDMFASLAKCSQLTMLAVERADRLTDRGSSVVVQCPLLVNLTLRNARSLTNECLPAFARLPQLHSLVLFNTNVNDAGLMHLRSAPKLRFLSLYNSQITAQGVQALNQVLPECSIVHGTIASN